MADVPGIITGSYLNAEATRKKAETDRKIAEANQKFAEYQAEDAIERGKESEQQYRGEVKRAIASSRASLAGQGVDVSSGSALEIQEDIAAMGELDALTIRNNARREAFGFKTQALNIKSQSAINYHTASSERYTTLLTGGINAGAKIGAFAFGGGFGGGAGGAAASTSGSAAPKKTGSL